jgi:hypothetical protein
MPVPVILNRTSNPAPATVHTKTIWTGGTGNGLFTAGKNWTSAAPVQGGIAYFADSSKSLTGNTDQQALNLEELRVTKTFTGSLGTNAAPLKISATKVVLDATVSDVHLQGSFNEIIVVGSTGTTKVGGISTNRIKRLIVQGSSQNVELTAGKCEEVVVTGSSSLTVDPGVSGDNTLDAFAGINRGRVSRTSQLSSSSSFINLDVTGRAELDAAAASGTLTLLPDSLFTSRSTAGVQTKLVMYGGKLRILNGATGDTFTINAADLYGGTLSNKRGNQNLTFTSNANILGSVVLDLEDGTTVGGLS